MKKILIASDHAGINLKSNICNYLKQNKYNFDNLGTNSDKTVDYPDYGYKIAQKMKFNNNLIGIAICGSGIGISIALNRYEWIRAALVYNVETASLSRKHNNSNVIVFGDRLIDTKLAIDCLEIFLKEEFEEGRHKIRIDKLNNPLKL